MPKVTVPRKWGAVFTIAALWLYALMAGGRPSVTRAVLMASLYFGALLFEREPDLPTSFGAAALVILFLQPTALLEPGFQMSFLTILTLALAMPVWDSFWRPRLTAHLKRPLVRKAALRAVELAGLSLFAQLGSLPIVASDYNEFPLTGWLANLLVVPTLFLLIPLGFIGALVWGAIPRGRGGFIIGGRMGHNPRRRCCPRVRRVALGVSGDSDAVRPGANWFLWGGLWRDQCAFRASFAKTRAGGCRGWRFCRCWGGA